MYVKWTDIEGQLSECDYASKDLFTGASGNRNNHVAAGLQGLKYFNFIFFIFAVGLHAPSQLCSDFISSTSAAVYCFTQSRLGVSYISFIVIARKACISTPSYHLITALQKTAEERAINSPSWTRTTFDLIRLKGTRKIP